MFNRIPKIAKPIAIYIRENVSRPNKFEIMSRDSRLRIKWGQTTGHYVCPLGMLKEATVNIPIFAKHFNPVPMGFTGDAIRAFTDWWDRQRDPQVAIDKVWGKR